MNRGLLKTLLVVSLAVVLTSGCAGMRKKRGGGGGGGGPPREEGGGGGGGGGRPSQRGEPVQLEDDDRSDFQRALDDQLFNQNSPLVQRGSANTDVNPDAFNAPNPGFAQALPGSDPNVIDGNPLDLGAGANLDPNATPQVSEIGFSPQLQVGNPQPAALRSNARRPVTRGLASHN